MRKTDSLSVNGNTYHVTQMGALQGRDTLTRLLAMVGPLMTEDLGKGLSSLKPEDLAALSDAFAALTEVELSNGKRPRLKDVFDDHFAGEYDAFFEWLLFCVRLNFQSFFAKALAKVAGLGQAMAPTESASSSSQNSGGAGA